MSFSDDSEHFSEQFSEKYSDEENLSLQTVLIEGIKLHNLTFQLTNYDFTCSNLSHPVWATSGLSEANLDEISFILEPHKQEFIKYLQNLNVQINEFILKVQEITNLEQSYLNSNEKSAKQAPRNRIIGKIHDDLEYFFIELPTEVKSYIAQNVLLKVYTNEVLSQIVEHYFTKDHSKLCCGVWESCYSLARVRIARLIFHYNDMDITEEATNLAKMLSILNSQKGKFSGDKDVSDGLIPTISSHFTKTNPKNQDSIKSQIKLAIVHASGNLLSSHILHGLTTQNTSNQTTSRRNPSQSSISETIKSVHDDCFNKIRIISEQLTTKTKIFDQPPNYTPNRKHVRKKFRWQDDIANELTEKLNGELVSEIQVFTEDVLVTEFLKLAEGYNDGRVIKQLNFNSLPDHVNNLVTRSVAKYWLRFGIAEIVKSIISVQNGGNGVMEIYSLALIQLEECLSKTDFNLIDNDTLKSVLEFARMMMNKFTTEIDNSADIKPESSVNHEKVGHLSGIIQGVQTIKPILKSLLQYFEKIDDKLESERVQWIGFGDLVDQISNLEADFLSDRVNDKLRGFYEANARLHILQPFISYQFHKPSSGNNKTDSRIKQFTRKFSGEKHKKPNSQHSSVNTTTLFNLTSSSIYKNNRDYNQATLALVEKEILKFTSPKIHFSRTSEFLSFVSSLESLLNEPAESIRDLYKNEVEKQANAPMMQVPKSRYCTIQ